LADLEGSLDLSGSVEGPRRLPRLRLRGEGRGIGFAGYRMETARVRASVDMAAPGAVEAEAAGAGVRGPLVEGSDGRLRLSLEGDLERQSLRLETSDAERALRASLEGGFQDSPDSWRAVTGSRWAGRLTGLRISDPSLGDWDLDDPAELRAARDAISLAEGCLLGGEASLCVEGEWRPGPEGDWRARAELDGLGWSRLRELWPPGLGLGGSASVTATARGRGESPEALSIEARSGPGHLSWTADGTTGRVDHQGATLSLAADEGGARGRAEWDLGPLGGLEAELRAEAPSPGVGAFERLKARPLEAAASVRLESLSALDPFLEALQDVDGRLNGTLRVAGSWQEPRPSGRLQLQEAQARVPALGTTWEQIELTARTAGAHRIELEGSGRCGEGTANVVGEARLAESGEPELSLEIRGERVTLLDRPEAWLLADPELTVALRPDRIAVNGSVTVPEGKLDIEEGQGAPVESSPDVVVVRGERPVEPESSALPQMLEVHVRVELGDSVAVTGQGLDARLAGALEIDQEPGQPLPTGDGVIRIEDGEYKAYGRKLELRRGRLMFQGGPVDDPALDVVAAREAEDGTLAGVRISGRASAPEIALWSRPELADEEALSYLLFGRPQDATASKSEQGVFQRAAASLGLGGGSMLVKQLGKPLGLDKAKIEPGGTLQDAALVLGKYLSPRLYVAYGVGLFEPVNSFRLRYMLTPHWTLEAQSGEGAGGDLLYVIERPKP
jgi:translocation and assembly module TamB